MDFEIDIFHGGFSTISQFFSFRNNRKETAIFPHLRCGFSGTFVRRNCVSQR